MRISFFSHTASSNAIVRVFSLWMLTQVLGWDTRVHVPSTEPIWPGLRHESDFHRCFTRSLDEAASWGDLLVAVKPLVMSLGPALRVQRLTGKPLVLDLDEADWEERYGFGWRATISGFLARAARGRPRMREVVLRTRRGRIAATTISNPTLARWYNGTVLPHVAFERDRQCEATPDEAKLTVAFVGTPRAHKGLAVLREAVRLVPDARLVVTATPPANQTEREEWAGATSTVEGVRLMERSDVVAIPSLDVVTAHYQLPYKLITAMHAGCAIVASDLAPIRWAMSDAGILVPPGDGRALAAALERMKDPVLRQKLGSEARARARERFTPRVVAPSFAAVMERLAS